MIYFSFVMLCWNNWNYTKNALDSFFECLNPAHKSRGVELILVNNGSSDETAVGIEEYKMKYKEVINIFIIHLERNFGYVIGVNKGLENTNGEIIIILNNDLIFCPHWFDNLVNILETDQTVGLAGPLLTNGSGPENIKFEFESEEVKDLFFKSKDTLNYYAEEIMKNNKNMIMNCDRVVGACIAIKREVLELIGGLDFWFGIGLFDDDDLSLRINIAGYKTVIVGGAFVYHVGSATFNKDKPITYAAMISNAEKFCRKWSLSSVKNSKGIYQTRMDVIKNTSYNRKQQFLPFSIDQYELLHNMPRDEKNDIKKLLLVADWTNVKSKWIEKLELVLSQIDENYKIYCWIPNAYFSKTQVINLVENAFKNYNSKNYIVNQFMEYLDCNIDPIDLLQFLTFFDVILNVENDFVNMQITNLSSKINIQVK